MAGRIHDKSDSGANAEQRSASEPRMASAATVSPQPLPRPADMPHCDADHVDLGWLTQLIEREGAGILQMLWRLLGREQDVLDAYQDCFCKLAARRRRGNLRSVRAYAYRTAANIAIEMIRVRRRRAAHRPVIAAERSDTRADDGGEGESEHRLARLRDAIARLPTHLRNVVVLRDLSRMSYSEVARMLGIEPTTARVYRHHAVVKLAEFLSEGDES